jgi:hypothetical protein
MRLLPNQSLERDAAKSAAPLSLIRYQKQKVKGGINNERK